MKTTTRNRISCLTLTLIMIMSIFAFSAPKVQAASSVDDFVTRCYKVAFGREPDQGGFDYWKSQITEGKLDGSAVVNLFIFSDEYKAKNTDNKQYINDLYTMFMGREADTSGYDFWCKEMDNGSSREAVFAGFANSPEFYDICSGCGITAGYFTNEYPLGQVNNVNLFVERLYKVCLGRVGDKDGQAYWVNGLLKGELQGVACAANFIRSKEYKDKNLCEAEYIKNLYIAMMGREFDKGGLAYWLSMSDNGLSNDGILLGFALSAEFKGICDTYGIVQGTFVTDKKAPVSILTDSYYEYDSNNKLARTVCPFADGSGVDTYIPTYDGNGFIIREDCKEGAMWSTRENNSIGRPVKITGYYNDNIKSYEEILTYNSDNLLTSSEETVYFEGQIYTVNTSKYDENEKRIDSTCVYYENNKPTDKKYVINYFDGYAMNGAMYEGGKIVEADSYYPYTNRVKENQVYDSYGDLICKNLYNEDGSRKKTYKYQSEKLCQEETYFGNEMRTDYYDESGKATSFSITTFDSENRVVRYEGYTVDGIPTSTSTTEYPSLNVSKTRYYDDKDNLTSISVITTNDAAQIIKEEVYDSNEKLKTVFTYEYDSEGHLIKEEQKDY